LEYLIEENKISRLNFNRKLKKKLNIKTIRNYYGMIEQTGSIYLECKCGYLTSSNLSEIIIRDEKLNPCDAGKKGLIQTLSLLPSSYPGHSILTEDIGELINSEKCRCNMKGTKFLVHGRNEKSEIRGCSDI
jgi:Acyl-protein synthetase, LuxE.